MKARRTAKLDGIELPRTPGLEAASSMAHLLACDAVPGFEGVILTDEPDDHTTLYSSIFDLSQKIGIEFALTRENGELVLRSGAPGQVGIPFNAELLAHTHPYEPGASPQSLPSRTDINLLNTRWARRPDTPPPRSDIVWATGQTMYQSITQQGWIR